MMRGRGQRCREDHTMDISVAQEREGSEKVRGKENGRARRERESLPLPLHAHLHAGEKKEENGEVMIGRREEKEGEKKERAGKRE